jgi:signal transduction histidine kinase
MELLIKNNLALAKIARKKNDYVTSNQFALKAYQYADEKDAKEDIRDISIMLSNNYEDLGDFKNALEYHKIFKSVEDTIYNRESQFKLNILRTEYDLEYRDNEIEALQAKNKLQNNLAKAQKNQNILLIIGFLSSIVFFIILFILYRKQRSFSVKLTRQKDLLIEQKEEIETAQEQIVNQNETLHHLNKEKDNLIAMVAHDLRSPLNQIRGVLGLVKMEQNNDSIGQLIDIANQSSEVLSERINRILDIEAINAGKINLKTEHLNVKKVLGSLHQNIHGTAVQKQMNLIIDPHADISCLADENYLLQVLENLCTNAIKFSPENSEIKISVTEVEKNVLFAVKDQGPGISEVDKINLFLPYSKTSNKPTGDETSTGLGLAIVKKYVEAMAGEVWVESEGNTGSVFYVKLPKAA